jgi:CDP-diacylglycerol--glycerol-3-phosphate 3-phosphatidyltransferase
MTGKSIGDGLARARDSVARLLFKAKVSPNALTVTGMVASLAAGMVIAYGYQGAGAAIVVFTGFCDLMDGAVAKVSGAVTTFGSFLDSFLDRYSDFAIYIGIAVYFMNGHNWPAMAFSVSAMVGSVLISYVRARAENLIDDCTPGFWKRGERVVFIILGLIAGRIDVVVYVLGVMTHVTALHRAWHTHSVIAKGTPLALKNPVLRCILGDFKRKTLPHYAVAGTYALLPFAALAIERLLQ